MTLDWWPRPEAVPTVRRPATPHDPAGTPLPTALGYVRAAPGREALFGSLRRAITCLDQFAVAGGYALGQVFVEDRPPYRQAWDALLEQVRHARPVAVLVPEVDGVRLPPLDLATLQARLAHVTTAPLVLARPAPGTSESEPEPQGEPAPVIPWSGVRWAP